MRSNLACPAFLPCHHPHCPSVALDLFFKTPSGQSLFHGCRMELSAFTAHLGPLPLELWASAYVFFSFKKSLKSGVSAVTFGNVFTAYRDFLTCFISSWW